MSKVWSNEDPRIVNYLNNFIKIIVIRNNDYFPGIGECFVSDCDSINKWVIYIDFPIRNKFNINSVECIKIEADQEWDSNWFWTYSP